MGDTLLNFIYIFTYLYILFIFIYKLEVNSCTEMEKRALQSKLLKMQVTCRKDLRETDAKNCIQIKLLLKNHLNFF